MPKNKICIYAICKNEIRFVDRWFNSIKNADYVCVLDTGSSDGTYEKLLSLKTKFPDKVIVDQKVITPWRFDSARNESMKLIPSDTTICVSADLDDVFKPDWYEVVQDNIEKGYNKIIGQYQYYENDIPTECTNLDRISVYGQAHWEGAMHERLVCENINEIHDPRFTVEHRQDITKDRRELYFETAKAAVNEKDPYSLLCFGYECYNYEKYEDCINCFLKLYNILPKDSEYLTRKWVKLLAETYQLLNNKTEYEKWLKKSLEIENKSSPFEDYFLYDGMIENQLAEFYRTNRLEKSTKVCVYTICKNELNNLYNWIKPLKTADYICVLDTGSTDGTYEALIELQKDYPNLYIKQKHYDKFFFDEGRNDSLELVRDVVNKNDNNILLCLDLDEYASTNIVEAIKSEWKPELDVIELYCKNVDMQVIKCYPLTDTLYWKYKIHEEVVCDKSNKIVLQGGYYNHYQDLSKGRNYYNRLQEAYESEPTCIHYLTYLIWEAQLHEDLDKLRKYCVENIYQILNNKKDQHYLDWYYYIYTCLVYIDVFGATQEEIKTMIEVLNGQEENFKSYYLFKSKLSELIENYSDTIKSLTKALYTDRTNNWVEENFKETDAEICTKLNLIYYYNFSDYEKAYLWAEKALQLENNELTRTNVEICKKRFKESIYEK